MQEGKRILRYVSFALLFSVILLASSCTLFGPQPLPNQPVTDQTKLEPSDPRYVAELLADDELQTIVNDVS